MTTETTKYELTGTEAETRHIFEALLKDSYKNDDHSIHQGNIIVASVFKAMYYASLPVAKIERIGKAMHGLETCDLQKTLTRLVRAKVLRSRYVSGVNHYEVNY